MIWRSVLAICVAFSSTLATAECPAEKPEEVLKILSRSIELNEQFKRSVESSDAAYISIRKKNEDYSESVAIPCFLVGADILDRGLDLPLLRAMIEFSVSHENSADESIYEALNRVRDAYPEAVSGLVSKLPQSQGEALMRNLSDVGGAVRGVDPKTESPCWKKREGKGSE